MPALELLAPFEPAGDQPAAITALNRGLTEGQREQILLGVTGSGKTFTIANVIAEQQRPTLVLSPNKTLAAQLWAEFREFFPKNAVEYFVSYYDFYQPEAYIPRTDTYIEKDSSRNDEIDRLRNSATRALLTRRDVVVVASISCIYGIGSPENYLGESITVKRGRVVAPRHPAAQALRPAVRAQRHGLRAHALPGARRRRRRPARVRGDRDPHRVHGRHHRVDQGLRCAHR